MSAFVKKSLERTGGRAANPLKISVRSLYLLKEFGKGEHLALPDNCQLEFPDATRDGDITSDKYKRFVVHYKPDTGIYAGGTFRMMFDVSAVPEYPYKPPKVSEKRQEKNNNRFFSVVAHFLFSGNFFF